MKPETIQSLKELQLQMPSIIQQYGADNNFTKLALANPLVALERAGYRFTDDAKDEIEHYVRFGREGLEKLHYLKEDIFKHTGTQMNLDDSTLVADMLIRILSAEEKQPSPAAEQQPAGTYTNAVSLDRDKLINILNTRPRQVDKDWQDELQSYSTLHPVIPLMIEYRKMQTANPRFATPAQIPAIEEKLKTLPLQNVVFTMKRNNR